MRFSLGQTVVSVRVFAHTGRPLETNFSRAKAQGSTMNTIAMQERASGTDLDCGQRVTLLYGPLRGTTGFISETPEFRRVRVQLDHLPGISVIVDQSAVGAA
jgi:hypothetical protein